MRICRGAPPCAPESTGTKHVMIKRAHTEVRPYRLIVLVVLHFLPLAAYFRLLAGGGQEGIVYSSNIYCSDPSRPPLT